MRLSDLNRIEQRWGSTALIIASSAGIFSLVGRVEPLNNALFFPLTAFALSLPLLCLSLWAFTFYDETIDVGSIFALATLARIIGSVVGFAALFWGLNETAGAWFIISSIVALAIGSFMNRRAMPRHRS